MLSLPTLAFLAELQEKSHSAYAEGGLLYTYIEAANQAHSRYSSSAGTSAALSSQLIQELGRFIQASQGNYQEKLVDPAYQAAAKQFFELLKSDLKFDDISWSLEDGGHDMTALISMARHEDNRFFSLELMWSID